MAKRVAVILDRLERSTKEAGADQTAIELPPLSYFDRTRWRRRQPPDLTDGRPKSLGDRIRQRRLELGISQAELGKQFGVGRSAVRQWERGKSEPRKSRRNEMAKFLGGV
jgi:ribosome-binding protein aMBF1 (putative translation factor)